MRSRRRYAGFGLALLAGLGVGLAAGVQLHRWVVSRGQDPVTTAAVFQDVMSAIRSSFVDSLSDAELAVRAAKGVVSSLGDPYSSVLSQSEFHSYRHALAGTGSSLGLALVDGLTGVRIGAVLPGSAADRAGLHAGQFVVAIDGLATAGVGLDRLVGQVRVAAGPTIVEVRSPGDSLARSVELEPGPVRVPAVGAVERLAEGIGYVALGAVSIQATRQLREALATLDPSTLAGLILDFRGNYGGRLDEALEIADLFLAEGQRIGAVTRRKAFPALYVASSPESHASVRLAVLVDRRTASSAEIIAAALQDHRRAMLVGERTLGKGLIQTTIALGDSVALRLSTGRWQRPSGTAIDRGLVPDVTVEIDRAERRVRSALDARKDIVARHLELAARRVVAEGQAPESAALTGPELTGLGAALAEAEVDLPDDSLAAGRQVLDRELRWLSALAAGDRRLAGRLRHLADPVVAAGLELLIAGSFRTASDSAH